MSPHSNLSNEYHPGDELSINAFYNECFRTTRSTEEWRWKFLRNPLSPLVLLRSVRRGDELVGHCGILPVRFRLHDHDVCAGEIVDFGINSSWHSGFCAAVFVRQLNRAIQEDAARHGLAFAFGFPNYRSYGVVKKISGGKDLIEIPIWRKWLNPYGYLIGRIHSRLIQRVGRVCSKTSMRLRQRLGHILLRPEIQMVRLMQPDDRLDIVWENVSPTLGSACMRDKRYIAWRYFDKPGSPYSVLLFQEHGVPIGYAVTTIKEEDVRIGYIMDMLCRPDRETMKKLLSTTYMSLAGVDLVKCLMTRTHPLANVLVELGFRIETERIRMLVQVFDDTIDRSFFFDARNWYITFGDLDGM